MPVLAWGAPPVWATSGTHFHKDGVDGFPIGIYYVDYFADSGAHATARLAAIDVIGATGLFDFIYTPISTTSAATVTKVASYNMNLCAEPNSDIGDLRTTFGANAFNCNTVLYDIDRPAGPSAATVTTTANTQLASFPNAIQHGSGGYVASIANYFGCTLSNIGFQIYPIGDGDNPKRCEEESFCGVMRPYTKPWIAEVQAFDWSTRAGRPTAAELKRMFVGVLNNGAAGVVFYTYYDGTYQDMSLSANQYLWTAIVNMVTEFRHAQSYWITRHNNLP